MFEMLRSGVIKANCLMADSHKCRNTFERIVRASDKTNQVLTFSTMYDGAAVVWEGGYGS